MQDTIKCLHVSAQSQKADSTLSASQPVPQASTRRALHRLTSEVERDPVHSVRNGRQRAYEARTQLGCNDFTALVLDLEATLLLAVASEDVQKMLPIEEQLKSKGCYPEKRTIGVDSSGKCTYGQLLFATPKKEEKWSDTHSCHQRSLPSIQAHSLPSACSVEFCLLCCQPEPSLNLCLPGWHRLLYANLAVCKLKGGELST